MKAIGFLCHFCKKVSEQEGCGLCRIPSEASESTQVHACECNPLGNDVAGCKDCESGWVIS